MASWDNLGEISNIAQLTGLDAVKLISLIVRAASTARMHKSNCHDNCASWGCCSLKFRECYLRRTAPTARANSKAMRIPA